MNRPIGFVYDIGYIEDELIELLCLEPGESPIYWLKLWFDYKLEEISLCTFRYPKIPEQVDSLLMMLNSAPETNRRLTESFYKQISDGPARYPGTVTTALTGDTYYIFVLYG